MYCISVLIGNSPPSRIWAHIRGRYWSSKIDVYTHLWVILKVEDLVEALIVEVVVVAPAGDGGEAERLEDDAEEPGEEDVAGYEPGQLTPVLLALAYQHRVRTAHAQYSKLLKGKSHERNSYFKALYIKYNFIYRNQFLKIIFVFCTKSTCYAYLFTTCLKKLDSPTA
jgi:hypothetical protein